MNDLAEHASDSVCSKAGTLLESVPAPGGKISQAVECCTPIKMINIPRHSRNPPILIFSMINLLYWKSKFTKNYHYLNARIDSFKLIRSLNNFIEVIAYFCTLATTETCFLIEHDYFKVSLLTLLYRIINFSFLKNRYCLSLILISKSNIKKKQLFFSCLIILPLNALMQNFVKV